VSGTVDGGLLNGTGSVKDSPAGADAIEMMLYCSIKIAASAELLRVHPARHRPRSGEADSSGRIHQLRTRQAATALLRQPRQLQPDRYLERPGSL